jgi:hypothetical protein
MKAACFYIVEVDELVWCAVSDGYGNNFTETCNLKDIPDDGLNTLYANYLENVKSSGDFLYGSGGVDGEFG